MTNRNLDPFIVAFGNLPDGYDRLLDFCIQVESGESPDQEILNDLAAAFRKMIRLNDKEKSADVLVKAVGLKGKRGRPYQTACKDQSFERAFQVHMYEVSIPRQSRGL